MLPSHARVYLAYLEHATSSKNCCFQDAVRCINRCHDWMSKIKDFK